MNAVIALLSPMSSVPVKVPGGNPVMDTPVVPRSPEMLVAPVLVIPAVPERAPKVENVPRSIWQY